MKSIYIFSGLGADERVFKYLDFSNFEITFIQWKQPNDNEPIEHYAKRLIDQITTTRPILIGLSFGGIIATEVAKLIDTEKIILINSVKTRKEIPFYYRLAGYLNLHQLLPIKLLKRPTLFTNWFFGTQNKEDKKMLSDILHDTDAKFLKWAINKIVSWTNQTRHQNLKHIHGTSDRILPIRFVDCDLKVIGGGHFMTVNKSDDLNIKLKSLI